MGFGAGLIALGSPFNLLGELTSMASSLAHAFFGSSSRPFSGSASGAQQFTLEDVDDMFFGES